VMRKRLDQRLGLANAAASDASVASTTPIAAGWNEAQELEQANALYSFIGNRYAQKVRAHLTVSIRLDASSSSPVPCSGIGLANLIAHSIP
jgi:hypothetical protein